MQKRLDENDILISSANNEDKSVVAERFTKTLKGKIRKKMTTNDSNSCLNYLNKLVDEYKNNYHCSTDEKTVDADYSALTEQIESSHKAPKFKVSDRVTITKYKNIFSKGYNEHWSREILVIDSVLKTNPWTYKIKYLNGEKIIASFS